MDNRPIGEQLVDRLGASLVPDLIKPSSNECFVLSGHANSIHAVLAKCCEL
jgi:hypothetical protein